MLLNASRLPGKTHTMKKKYWPCTAPQKGHCKASSTHYNHTERSKDVLRWSRVHVYAICEQGGWDHVVSTRTSYCLHFMLQIIDCHLKRVISLFPRLLRFGKRCNVHAFRYRGLKCVQTREVFILHFSVKNRSNRLVLLTGNAALKLLRARYPDSCTESRSVSDTPFCVCMQPVFTMYCFWHRGFSGLTRL